MSTGQVSSLPGYAEGQWWVQDAAAALPVKLLEPQPDMRVLDLCAAPGGKTMQLAAAGAIVTSLDQSEARMARFSENLERTRLSAKIVVADALTWSPDTEFDAILLDAPCSATGTLRRHPDLVHAKAAQSFGELTILQSTLIDRALNWLKPGGALVYCTCSLLPEEAEAQLDAALVRHPELVIELPDLSWIEPQWRTHSGALRIRPDHWADRGGIDGFFMFRLRKPA
jgi:16S rRNA (cytosine967-C5)-methyltransferase